MTEIVTDGLVPHLRAVADATRAIDEAKAARAARYADLAAAIEVLATSDELTSEQRAEIIRDLYWEHPEVMVKHIAPLVGNAGQVPDAAGPYEMRCGGCAALVPVRTRSDLAHHRRWGPPQCDGCWRELADAEDQAWLSSAHPAAWPPGVARDHRDRVDVAFVTLDTGDARLLFALATAGKDDTSEGRRARNTLDSGAGGLVDAPADLVSWAVKEAMRLLDANELGVVGRVRASGLFERCTPSSLRAWLDRIERLLWASAPASGW